ncbi:unnamed protein product [Mycetohabitans rhizoxinica HKI 454]|uniref:Uncharacterized protein n=1 Tax=Mycetohabitans rhizoxinica (strain DSM 19002 / CIP 109453 / HKI 454) TaxID=882378 RepID=E5AR59_MYCRK|nr:unnamed protein product [Mycetohabitans rhizoxinica HKI 454]
MNHLGSRVYDALRVSICLSTDPRWRADWSA